MNGIDSGGEFTFERIGGKGASVIDYIMLDKELVEYERGEDPDDGLISIKQPQTGFSIGVNKLCYNPKSMKIWNEYPEVMSDHSLITCELRYPENMEEEKTDKVTDKNWDSKAEKYEEDNEAYYTRSWPTME